MYKLIMEEEFLTPKDIARILKVSYMTVFRWIQAKRLIAYKAGKQYRISQDNLSQFLKKHDTN